VKCLYNSLRVAACCCCFFFRYHVLHFFFRFCFSAEALRALTDRQTVGQQQRQQQQHCRGKYLKTYAKLFAVCHVNGFSGRISGLPFRPFFCCHQTLAIRLEGPPTFGQLICRLLQKYDTKAPLNNCRLNSTVSSSQIYFTQRELTHFALVFCNKF